MGIVVERSIVSSGKVAFKNAVIGIPYRDGVIGSDEVEKVKYSVANMLSATDRILGKHYSDEIEPFAEAPLKELWSLYDWLGGEFWKQYRRRFESKYGNRSINCN